MIKRLTKKEYMKEYRLKNREKLLKQMRDYSRIHKEQRKKYYNTHIERFRELDRIRYPKRSEYMKKYLKEYYQDHKKEIYQYIKNKFKTNINCKLAHYLRTRIVRALRGNPKLFTTMKLVGCSIEKLKQHLEKQFTKGMNWSNYGKWHIDHIKPCASFDLNKPEEQVRCFNYKNLQPLWAKENLRKGKK
jgi:hypothetical protein